LDEQLQWLATSAPIQVLATATVSEDQNQPISSTPCRLLSGRRSRELNLSASKTLKVGGSSSSSNAGTESVSSSPLVGDGVGEVGTGRSLVKSGSLTGGTRVTEDLPDKKHSHMGPYETGHSVKSSSVSSFAQKSLPVMADKLYSNTSRSVSSSTQKSLPVLADKPYSNTSRSVSSSTRKTLPVMADKPYSNTSRSVSASKPYFDALFPATGHQVGTSADPSKSVDLTAAPDCDDSYWDDVGFDDDLICEYQTPCRTRKLIVEC
jgi:hypothetical protein